MIEPTLQMIDLNGSLVPAVPMAMKDRMLKRGWQLAITVKDEPFKPTPINEVSEFLGDLEKQKCCDKGCQPEIVAPEAVAPGVVEPEVPEVPEITKPKEIKPVSRKVVNRKRK